MYAEITPEEKRLTENIPTKNLTAYDLYLRANDYTGKFIGTRNIDFYQKAVNLYNAALELDSTFARVYSGLAHAYLNRYVNEEVLKENYLDSSLVLANMALLRDDQIDEAYFVKGLYYNYKGQYDAALDNFDRTIKVNPNFYHAYYWKATLYSVKGDYVKAIENGELTVKYSTPKERPDWQRIFGFYYLYSGFIDKAKTYLVETINPDSNRIDYLEKSLLVELFRENFDEALRLSDELTEIAPSYIYSIKDRLWLFTFIPGHNEEALTLSKRFIEQLPNFPHLGTSDDYMDWIGYFNWQAGNQKEARYYFDQKIKYCETKIKLAKDFECWSLIILWQQYTHSWVIILKPINTLMNWINLGILIQV